MGIEAWRSILGIKPGTTVENKFIIAKIKKKMDDQGIKYSGTKWFYYWMKNIFPDDGVSLKDTDPKKKHHNDFSDCFATIAQEARERLDCWTVPESVSGATH